MARKRKRLSWLLALLSRLIIIPAAAALILSYISIYINPVKFTLPLFFGLYFVPLVLLKLLILLIGIIRRSTAVWLTFIALLPSILYAELFVRWGEVQKEEEGIALKICTYNVGLFAQGEGQSRTASFEGIKKFILEENPAIVCMQEFQISNASLIAKEFPEYPYQYYHLFNGTRRKFGNLTLSKLPIINSGKITFKRSTNLCIYTDIEHYGKTIRVYNTHLESHSISFTALIQKIRENEKIREEIYQVHDKVASTFKRRALQVDTIARHMHQSPIPAIICGDFNDTPMSYTYRNLISGKKDSFRHSGKGFSATYSLLWPLLRLDYIFYPAPFWSLTHNSPKIDYSDHYPVISQLIIP
ncbi:MAG: endonuclease/exonuclease/phosphatase family protein [Bacteroidales bacterium]|nr:endonuclease/exonuclease/phosphatase family protein [Bacteroidales bacterium]